MAFDINSAVEVTKNDVIPTTPFDINSAQELNPPAPVSKVPQISKALREVFKWTPFELIRKPIELGMKAKDRTLSKPKAGETPEGWMKRISTEYEAKTVEEGVMRQVEGPMLGAVAGGLVTAPLMTIAGVGAFSVKDYFFNGRRYMDENFPDADPTFKDVVEILDNVATMALIGGAGHFAKKFAMGRFGKLNLSKGVKLEPVQVESIKGTKISEKLGITPEQSDVSIKTGTPVMVPIEKAIDLAIEPGWGKTSAKLLPEEQWSIKQEKINKAREGFVPGKKPVAETYPDGVKPPEIPITPSMPLPTVELKKTPPAAPTPFVQKLGPGENVSGLSKSVEATAIHEKLVQDFGDLPTYQTRNMADVAQRASEFISTDYELAKKIALGESPEVGDLRAQELYTAIRIKAQVERDVPTLKELASSDKASSMATELGQRIKALDASEGTDPVAAMRELKKLGKEVSDEEAGQLVDFANEVERSKVEALKVINRPGHTLKTETPEEMATRTAYGKARIAFEDYLNGLKTKTKRKSVGKYVHPSNWGEVLSDVAGIAKSMKASFDNSVIGRQGLKTLFTHPDVWAKNSYRSFGDFWNSMATKNDAMLEVRAEVLSRPNSLRGLYKKEGLAVGVREEAYPTSIPEKIPVLGHAFKGSQDAFTAWQFRTRADVFDRLVDVAGKSNADISGLGLVVNSLTGRGNIGSFEAIATPLNNIFFSPRFLKSNLDLLTVHAFDKGKIGKFARKEAAKNLVKVIFGIASILGIAKSLKPDSVETDSRSSDFGKIKIGDTRFDVSGGMASLVTLASRVVPALWGDAKTKSSTTGILTPVNSGKYGSKTGLDVLMSFFEGKLSPASGIVRDILKGRDFQGNRPTLIGEMNNLLAPLPVVNFFELSQNPNSAPILAAMLSDALGVGTNTYGTDVDWTSKIGVELEQFHKKVGEVKFKEANKEFNEKFRKWFDIAKNDEKYKGLTEDEKGLFLSRKRNELKDSIFRKYGFRYKSTKHILPRIK